MAIRAAMSEVRELPPPPMVVHRILCPLPTTVDASGIGFVLGGMRGHGKQDSAPLKDLFKLLLSSASM